MRVSVAFIIALLFAVVFISGCAGQPEPQEPKITAAEISNVTRVCIAACQSAVAAGLDLARGPCLLDPFEGPIFFNETVTVVTGGRNWVCDVAHDPRQTVDNLPENQCQSYLNGTAKYFVEVNETCDLIRTVPECSPIGSQCSMTTPGLIAAMWGYCGTDYECHGPKSNGQNCSATYECGWGNCTAGICVGVGGP